MNEAFRLSRLKAPRSSTMALVLLVGFFIVFGLIMTAAADAPVVGPGYFELNGRAPTVVNWLVGGWKELAG